MRADVVPTALGMIWKELLSTSDTSSLFARGIIPILTRISIDGGDGPFAIEAMFAGEGSYALTCSRRTDGSVDKILLDMSCEVRGPLGRTNMPPPANAGERALVGRVQAEHVFTRPFADAKERRVTELPLGGGSYVPPVDRQWRPATDLLDLPEGATAEEPELVRDPFPLVMGLSHTDSNQHVNSMVYPRLFEEAALRRLRAAGASTAVLSRRVEVAYRRPSFAGETLAVALRRFRQNDKTGFVGAFYGEDDGDKPRVCVRALFG